jgi:L-seryl-tRNA(Ser) seleniumtransferase
MSDRSTGAGVRETEIWEIEAAITDRTAAIAYTAGPSSCPPLKAVCALAKGRAVPVIVDAAPQLPPPSNLKRFIAEGADIVAFSGGKAIRGPQGTGIIAGRHDLIASVALQQLDMDVTFELWTPPADLIPKDKLVGAPRHGVGRGYKVAKEQIVGLIVALQLVTEERAKKDYERWIGLLGIVERGLKQCAKVKTLFLAPRQELGFPLLELQLNEQALGWTAYDLVARLRHGKPPIYVGERKLTEGAILINPVNLDETSTAVLLERLLTALGS